MTKVHRVTLGTGPRAGIALHCTMAHAGAWLPLLQAMPGEWQLEAIDMPSHGRSGDWDEQGNFQDVVTEAARPMLTGAEGPRDLIGHSFGATVALRLAVEHPQAVRSLILIEPVLFAIARTDAPALLADHDAVAGDFIAAIEAGDRARAARLFNRSWSGDGPRWPDLPEATRNAMARAIHVVPGCTAAIYDDTAGVLAPARLAELNLPVLLLRGAATHPVIGAVNEGLARRLPDARSEVIVGAGHMLPITHPVQTADALRRFWSESRA